MVGLAGKVSHIDPEIKLMGMEGKAVDVDWDPGEWTWIMLRVDT